MWPALQPMSLIKEVKLYAEMLADGATYRGDCPECKRKKTFTVTRRGNGYVYNCYSTHCGMKGASGIPALVDNLTRVKSDGPKVKPYKVELERLDREQQAFLYDKIGFQDRHVWRSGVKFAPVDDRYAFPIMGPTGLRRGYVLRSYEPNVDPKLKALTYMDREEPHLSWYGMWDKDCVLIVEDIPSAVRASVYFQGMTVAICGGGVGPDYVREIMAYTRNVVWALDPDATAVAIEHHSRYGLCFDSSRVLPIEADFKNMADGTISSVLAEVNAP